MTPIEVAVNHCGGQKALADAIGTAASFVHQWLKGERPIPAKWCIPIETATDRAVTRHELRPDIFGEAKAA